MSISAQPYSPVGSTPVLKPMFDALGLSGPDPIIIGPMGRSESDKLDFKPGERDLKTRILTLIENNRPNIALDLMQKTAKEDRELFDDLLFEVEEALVDNGFEKDAKELNQMADRPQIQEPKVDHNAVQNSLFLG